MSLFLSIVLCVFSCATEAWVVSPLNSNSRLSSIASRSQSQTSRSILFADATSSVTTTDTATATSPSSTDDKQAEEDDDDDEWEYVEFDALSEIDLIGSEWLVGTCWDDKADKIDETWCRLASTEEGQNIAIWGDKSEGKWNLDVASQYLTISKNKLWGKQIWASVVEDYYFLQGTVRGWSFVTAAVCEAQWQGKRLGVDPEEAGTAPWFEENAEGDESEAAALEAAAPAEDEAKE